MLCLLVVAGSVQAQTVLWQENFDDGNGNSRWYADNGVWQIGSPTIGPTTNSAGCQSFSCPDCGTTGLDANYPASMNSRLVRIQKFVVPPASQFPRLRFWHWYNLASRFGAGTDVGVVEISVSANVWQAVSPQYTGFSGDWTYASVDLSAFSGQSIQLAFHLVGPAGGTPGWYLDDISVVSGLPIMPNAQDFETGLGDWYTEQGTWQVGSPTKIGGAPTNSVGAQARSGTNCVVTLLNANYPGGINSRLISPPFLLPPPWAGPYLRFWHWYNLASRFGAGTDSGVVEIRAGTNSWQAVSPQYVGYSQNWTEPFIDLTSFGGQTVQVAFHIIAPAGNGPGWYVDDVQIFPSAYAAFPPYLLITRAGTNTITTWTWLPNYSSFTLETVTNVTSTNWLPVTSTRAVVNGLNTTSNSIVGTAGFYRLIGRE